MSHTFVGPNDVWFVYNSDMSGDVTISGPSIDLTQEGRAIIPSDDLVAFVLEHLRFDLITSIEQLSVEQLKTLFTNLT